MKTGREVKFSIFSTRKTSRYFSKCASYDLTAHKENLFKINIYSPMDIIVTFHHKDLLNIHRELSAVFFYEGFVSLIRGWELHLDNLRISQHPSENLQGRGSQQEAGDLLWRAGLHWAGVHQTTEYHSGKSRKVSRNSMKIFPHSRISTAAVLPSYQADSGREDDFVGTSLLVNWSTISSWNLWPWLVWPATCGAPRTTSCLPAPHTDTSWPHSTRGRGQSGLALLTSHTSHFRSRYKTRYFTSQLIKKSDRTQQLSIFFVSRMVVTEQFWEYGLMAYVGETGGFVGLFLGWSLLQLEDFIYFISKMRISVQWTNEQTNRISSYLSSSQGYSISITILCCHLFLIVKMWSVLFELWL